MTFIVRVSMPGRKILKKITILCFYLIMLLSFVVFIYMMSLFFNDFVKRSSFRALQNKGFVFADRGKIELRGYGPLQTYFLIRNDGATDDELIGRSKFGNQDITYINEGKVDTPFVKGNRVHPANESPSSGGNDVTYCNS